MEPDVTQAGPSTASDSDNEKRTAEDQSQVQPPLSPNALKCAAADCLNSWIYYLQMLNSVCAAGLRLSHSLSALSGSQNAALSSQCTQAWDELSRATVAATHSVRAHIAAAMQDMSIGETFTGEDAQRQHDHNQQIVAENLLTFINLHYQFNIAGCECFGSMAMCPSCNTTPGGIHNPECSMGVMQQLFARLYQHEHDSRSQMSSPHFGLGGASDSPKSGQETGGKDTTTRHSPLAEANLGRGASPYQEQQPHRGPSPIHGFPEATRAMGPLETLKGRGTSRSPLHFPLFPLNCQRRWSEAAAVDVGPGDSGDSPMRRWSMPWDCAWPPASDSGNNSSVAGGTIQGHGRYGFQPPSKLVVPTSMASQERSRSTTPEAAPTISPGTISSGDGLAEAIQLLSCRPTRQSIPQTALPGHPLPGFVPPWAESHEERMHRRMYPGPASQRGNWQSIDVPHLPSGSGMSVTEHYDIFPPTIPLTSRKSSSSTDSSSCLSIHSRSTTSSSERGSCSEASGPEAIRLHQNLYSMWSGSEHLPFIRLPESQEPQDDSDTDDPPTEKSGGASPFPRPT
ncbi:uncharacterized protein LOC109603750 isoform X2 [Aethina tumida]|uniref:uncharacterized protein LOC109603750 isoform X2 n=1 Tax=Aethina tumida TaxID=116153 RepID=UPI002148FD91|nr:uncharacterized protein LOC109603750 isoform X2 [Aethina tumida]